MSNSTPATGEPVVEEKPGNEAEEDLTSRALRLRIRQQELHAELGVLALQRTSFTEMPRAHGADDRRGTGC
jgi:hypothetical protein